MVLSVIIVNYNVKYFLEQCLRSVYKATANISVEIFVIDNASTDGSKAYLEWKFKGVQFFWNTENLGFGKANNSVLAKATGKYILFLNPDTILAEDGFMKCISFLEQQENVGGLGVRMLDGTGTFLKESKRMLPNVANSFFKLIGCSKIFEGSKIFDRYYAGHLPQNQTQEIDVLAGAFFMVPKQALDITGGFDPHFFMYGEDVDLSYRLQKLGLHNYYFAHSSIVHFKGESTQKKSAAYIKNFYGAMQLFVEKHNKNVWAKIFIKWAIKLMTILARVKMAIQNLGTKSTLAQAENNCLLVGGMAEINFLKQRWPTTKTSYRLGYCLPITEGETRQMVYEKIQSFSAGKATTIVFAEGLLSNTIIFELMELLRNKYNFLFHQQNSGAIVGSNSKNEPGLVIVLNELKNH